MHLNSGETDTNQVRMIDKCGQEEIFWNQKKFFLKFTSLKKKLLDGNLVGVYLMCFIGRSQRTAAILKRSSYTSLFDMGFKE